MVREGAADKENAQLRAAELVEKVRQRQRREERRRAKEQREFEEGRKRLERDLNLELQRTEEEQAAARRRCDAMRRAVQEAADEAGAAGPLFCLEEEAVGQ